MANPDTPRLPPRLPGLSSTDTAWLVREAQRVLTDLGHPPEVEQGVALRLADGRVVGLDNLARTVRFLPRRRWGRAVRDQLTALIDISPHGPVDPADLRAKLEPREMADDFVRYDALEPLPGVVAVLATQGDRVSQMHGNLDLVGDRDDAYDTALANLAALPLPRHTRRRVDPDVRESWVEFLDAPDAWSAARVLVLPDLLRRLRSIEFPAHGVLVAVPTKHDLWLHVPVGESVVDTALRMAWQAYVSWSEDPYPISPDVFLLTPDMHAVRLVASHRTGCDVDSGAMHDLVRDATGPQQEAS